MVPVVSALVVLPLVKIESAAGEASPAATPAETSEEPALGELLPRVAPPKVRAPRGAGRRDSYPYL